jgi:alkanesulfonate monooxygenase SsuD/methylene tetrahydromethanopterin reductase-like flavin-dependent oxidoreductase (luciferase family)
MVTDGRFDAGLGTGWMLADYDTMGLPLDSPGLCLAHLGKAAEVLTRARRVNEVALAGAHCRVEGPDRRAAPRWGARPRLVMGTRGPRMVTLAARYADVVSVNVRFDSDNFGPERAGTQPGANRSQGRPHRGGGEGTSRPTDRPGRAPPTRRTHPPAPRPPSRRPGCCISLEEADEPPHVLVGSPERSLYASGHAGSAIAARTSE